ncbi:MAG: DUF3795 domain-containing protein [Methanomassiliicoccaceae archaeon]|nr:DUF3795 domain-containing protein [Methanomassiliicoccaceae archaeon]
MDKKSICFCGLYCENCIVRAKINPAAKVLYDEMRTAGFEPIINYIPGGAGFWPFLKETAEGRTFTTCQEGCGIPDCKIRACAREKSIELCALCESYPCVHFADFLKRIPLLEKDNLILREKGFEAWSKLQDERRAKGFTYQDKG